ncbi:hypothetical protein GOP47_0003193 [Adiantum capillus-veneris]|uniref:Uncharacterized protein n=1 Tax=Adiantum capillus-veneris TaxID=13818 RepID=A0A9D4VCC6_ADICA|nr:hypothetical protein GOP47_0003193 [Adiantum capillus-veneris]
MADSCNCARAAGWRTIDSSCVGKASLRGFSSPGKTTRRAFCNASPNSLVAASASMPSNPPEIETGCCPLLS